MSDLPRGDGWWEASDGKWYAPELHPEYRDPQLPNVEPPLQPDLPPQPYPAAKPDPRFAGFEPPAVGQRLEGPGTQRYPSVAPKQRSGGGRIVAIVFGGIFLLMAGGCGVFIWAYRDEIADATVDFSDGAPSDDPGTCLVTGTDFGEDYEIEATLTALSAEVESHYLLDFEVIGSDGRVLGAEEAVFRSMRPGEERTEDVFNVITADEPPASVSCKVTRVLRIDA